MHSHVNFKFLVISAVVIIGYRVKPLKREIDCFSQMMNHLFPTLIFKYTVHPCSNVSQVVLMILGAQCDFSIPAENIGISEAAPSRTLALNIYPNVQTVFSRLDDSVLAKGHSSNELSIRKMQIMATVRELNVVMKYIFVYNKCAYMSFIT